MLGVHVVGRREGAYGIFLISLGSMNWFPNVRRVYHGGEDGWTISDSRRRLKKTR